MCKKYLRLTVPSQLLVDTYLISQPHGWNLMQTYTQVHIYHVSSKSGTSASIILDIDLSFDNHINKVTITAFYHLKNISKVNYCFEVTLRIGPCRPSGKIIVTLCLQESPNQL